MCKLTHQHWEMGKNKVLQEIAAAEQRKKQDQEAADKANEVAAAKAKVEAAKKKENDDTLVALAEAKDMVLILTQAAKEMGVEVMHANVAGSGVEGKKAAALKESSADN